MKGIENSFQPGLDRAVSAQIERQLELPVDVGFGARGEGTPVRRDEPPRREPSSAGFGPLLKLPVDVFCLELANVTPGMLDVLRQHPFPPDRCMGYGVVDAMNPRIDTVEEIEARIICLSALLTTSMPFMKDLIRLLEARGIRHKYIVLVGGASVNADWAKAIGADGTAKNAADAVKLAREKVGM